MAQRSNTPIEVQKYLGGVSYPASKDDLVRCAEQHDAPEDLRETLAGLPADQFDSPAAVSKAVSAS